MPKQSSLYALVTRTTHHSESYEVVVPRSAAGHRLGQNTHLTLTAGLIISERNLCARLSRLFLTPLNLSSRRRYGRLRRR